MLFIYPTNRTFKEFEELKQSTAYRAASFKSTDLLCTAAAEAIDFCPDSCNHKLAFLCFPVGTGTDFNVFPHKLSN